MRAMFSGRSFQANVLERERCFVRFRSKSIDESGMRLSLPRGWAEAHPAGSVRGLRFTSRRCGRSSARIATSAISVTTGSAAIAVDGRGVHGVADDVGDEAADAEDREIEEAGGRAGGPGLGVERTAGRGGQRQPGGQCDDARPRRGTRSCRVRPRTRVRSPPTPATRRAASVTTTTRFSPKPVIEPARDDAAGDVADAEGGEEEPIFRPGRGRGSIMAM